MALDQRAADVEEGRPAVARHLPGNYIGKFGLLEYAVAYGRADEARAALAEIETRWPKDAAFAQTFTDRGLLVSRALIQAKCAGRSLTHPRVKRPATSSPGRTSTVTTPTSETHRRDPRQYYFIDLYGSKPWARRCCAIRGSKRCWCASVSRPIGARKAGPPAVGRRREADFECGLDTVIAK